MSLWIFVSLSPDMSIDYNIHTSETLNFSLGAANIKIVATDNLSFVKSSLFLF